MESSTKDSGLFSFCAVRTEPTGQTILVAKNEVAAYESLVATINKQFQPATLPEKLLAQSIVNYEWRLERTVNLEKGLNLLGQAKADANYEKEFKNLDKQARFFREQIKKCTAELNDLLKGRINEKRRGLFLVPKRQKT